MLALDLRRHQARQGGIKGRRMPLVILQEDVVLAASGGRRTLEPWQKVHAADPRQVRFSDLRRRWYGFSPRLSNNTGRATGPP